MRIDGGVRKIHAWGYSEVYAEPESCFTREELIQVLEELQKLSEFNAISSEDAVLLTKIKEHCKRKRW